MCYEPCTRKQLYRNNIRLLKHVFAGHNTRQTRLEEHLRVSGVQNQDERSDIRVDVQSEEQGQIFEMDFGRRRVAVATVIRDDAFGPYDLNDNGTVPSRSRYDSRTKLSDFDYFYCFGSNGNRCSCSRSR